MLGKRFSKVLRQLIVATCSPAIVLATVSVANSADVNAGPIRDNTDAQQKCPVAVRAYNLQWNTWWTTTVPAKMSVCGTNASSLKLIPLPADVNAGPIFSNTDAQQKCPVVAEAVYGVWTGVWKTTAPNTCNIKPKPRIYAGYFESWSGKSSNLSKVNPYVNQVIVSFAKPDLQYASGSLNLSSTGLEFWDNNGQNLKNNIALLRQKGTKVLLAVGGAEYNNFQNLNASAIAALVKDMGFDGVDIDYEPTGKPYDTTSTTNPIFANAVTKLRSLLSKPYIISVAGYANGANTPGPWNSGSLKNLLTNSTTSSKIDQVNVMSYDTGIPYDPKGSLNSYRAIFKRQINMGVEVPPEAWGNHVYTLQKVNNLANAVKQQAFPTGMMLWSIQKTTGSQTPSSTYPNAQMISTQICKNLSISTTCTSPLLLP